MSNIALSAMCVEFVLVAVMLIMVFCPAPLKKYNYNIYQWLCVFHNFKEPVFLIGFLEVGVPGGFGEMGSREVRAIFQEKSHKKYK